MGDKSKSRFDEGIKVSPLNLLISLKMIMQ